MILASQFSAAPVAVQGAVRHAAAQAQAATPAAALTTSQPPPAVPPQVGAYAPTTPGIGGAAAALVLVLLLIVGLAWVLKRLPGGALRQADGLRVVASIPLGNRERAAVVQVGGEQLLLGIGAGGVRTLHLLPQPLPTGERTGGSSPRPLPDFRQLLAQHLRRKA